MYAEVLRENAYLSRTVEVQENQKVIDTGLYGVVRHPMYSSTLILFLSMGLVLGSPVSRDPAFSISPSSQSAFGTRRPCCWRGSRATGHTVKRCVTG